MPSRIIHTSGDMDSLMLFLSRQALPVTVSYVKGAKRTNPQNSTVHMWFGQIAKETGQSQGEAKAECKLRYGLPIMERDNAAWVAKWHPLYASLPYDRRLLLFEVIPVTSAMTTRQLAEMMDAMQRDYRAQGIPLVDPDARKYEAEFAR